MVSGLYWATIESTSFFSVSARSFQDLLMALSSEVLMHSEMVSVQVEPQSPLPESDDLGCSRRQEPQWKLAASWRTHFSSRRTASARSISLEAKIKDWRMSLWLNERWENEMKWMKLSVGYVYECAFILSPCGERSNVFVPLGLTFDHPAMDVDGPEEAEEAPYAQADKGKWQMAFEECSGSGGGDARDRICLTSPRCPDNEVQFRELAGGEEHSGVLCGSIESPWAVGITCRRHSNSVSGGWRGAAHRGTQPLRMPTQIAEQCISVPCNLLSLHQFLPGCLNDVLHAVAKLSSNSTEKVDKVDWWKTVDVVGGDCWTLRGKNSS